MGRKPKQKTIRFDFFSHLEPATIHTIWAIIFIVLLIFFTLASLDKAGVVGHYTYEYLGALLGVGYFLLPLICGLVSIMFWKSLRHDFTLGQIISAFLFFISGLGLVDVFSNKEGGIIGNIISLPLVRLLDTYVTVVVLMGVMLISFIMMFNF